MSDELDPAEFVQRIRQLGEQRDQQDAERVRKLEEEIIQGRSERLARRAGTHAVLCRTAFCFVFLPRYLYEVPNVVFVLMDCLFCLQNAPAPSRRTSPRHRRNRSHPSALPLQPRKPPSGTDRKSTRLNSSHWE